MSGRFTRFSDAAVTVEQVKPLEVGIIGAGTAGSAAALFLARAGHQVTLYEQVPEPAAIGAGIVLQPSGMSVLAQLGLLEAVVARGAVLHELHCETPGRRAVVKLKYSDLALDLYGLGLHRGVLFQTLFEAVKREPKITLRCGVAIEDLQRAADGRNEVVEPMRRAAHGPHDLIIVADGARSSLRDDTALKKTVKKYPWGALWFVGRDEGHLFKRRLYQVVNGTQRLMGLLPTGLGPSGANPLVSLFWSLRTSSLSEWKAAGLEPWKEEVLRYAPEAAALLAQIQSIEQVLFAEYHDVVMYPWNTRDVVYLGDAAHATSPQLGQGCNLALVDAQVLAGALSEADSLAHALDAYSGARSSHLDYYQFATRWLTPFFQSDYAWLGPLRDFGMPLASLVPWFRKQMVLGMCGTSRGPLLRSMPLSSRPLALPDSDHLR
jgi:2-polyprenyl-6-methoxyphenol hydroxylase-like FAD-dependent oxidoreductase